MTRLISILLLLAIPAFSQDTALAAVPVPEAQPHDAHVRKAELVRVIDGDTAVLRIHHSRPPVELSVSQKIRLRDVHSFEAKTAEGERARAALIELLDGKKDITVLLFARWTADRQEGVIWADGVNVNAEMRKLPQGGR